jgi:hypothetical protein
MTTPGRVWSGQLESRASGDAGAGEPTRVRVRPDEEGTGGGSAVVPPAPRFGVASGRPPARRLGPQAGDPRLRHHLHVGERCDAVDEVARHAASRPGPARRASLGGLGGQIDHRLARRIAAADPTSWPAHSFPSRGDAQWCALRAQAVEVRDIETPILDAAGDDDRAGAGTF